MNKKVNNTYRFHIAMIILIVAIYILTIFFLWEKIHLIYKHLVIGLVCIIGATLTFHRVYNILGWFLFGMGYVLMSLELPSLSFKSDPILFIINIVVFSAFSIFYTTLLYRRIVEKELIIKTELKEIDELKEKRGQITRLKESVKEKNIQIENLGKELGEQNRKERQYIDTISESSKYIKEINLKHYESQLSTLFEFMIINKHNEFSGTGNFGLHSFQGNLDSILADFVGETNNTYWLVELKRERKDIKEEKSKSVRERQLKEITKAGNSSFKDIADKCHWIGWGENSVASNKRTILFSIYWDAIIKEETANPIELNEFALRAFSQDDPVGVEKNYFSEYLDFLLENSGKDTTSVGNSPIFIFVKDNHGRFKDYAITTISYFFERHKDIIHQKEIQKIRERERERGQNWEHDLGF